MVGVGLEPAGSQNTVCGGRWVLWTWPHRLHVCEVCAGFTVTGSPALRAGFRSGPLPPLAGRLRCGPACRFPFRPGSVPVPLAAAVSALVFSVQVLHDYGVCRVRRRAAVPGTPALLAARIARQPLHVGHRVHGAVVVGGLPDGPAGHAVPAALRVCARGRNGAWAPFRDAWFTKTGTDGKWLSDRELRKGFNAVKRDVYPWSTDLCPHVGQKTIRPMADGLNRRGRCRRRCRPTPGGCAAACTTPPAAKLRSPNTAACCRLPFRRVTCRWMAYTYWRSGSCVYSSRVPVLMEKWDWQSVP